MFLNYSPLNIKLLTAHCACAYIIAFKKKYVEPFSVFIHPKAVVLCGVDLFISATSRCGN